MIDPDRRNAIYQMHLAGVPLREISRQLHASRDSVRTVVRQQGVMPQTVRKDKIRIDPELLGGFTGNATVGWSASTRSCWRRKACGSAIPR